MITNKKKFYGRYNEDYYQERIKYYSKKHMIKYIKYFLKKNEIKWLDIGCGLGYFVKEAVEEGVDCYGIDISEYAVKNAIIKDRIKLGSITNIPFGDETFDVVSAFDVIEHIHPKDTEKAFSEIYRVLKKGGYLIMTTPNPCHIGDWIRDDTHINVRPPKFWNEMLKKFRFNVKMYYVPSFLKYYISDKFAIKIAISDKIAFWIEKPLRYFIGYIYNKKGRLYLFARKEGVKNESE